MSQSDQSESTIATHQSVFPCPLSPEADWPGDQIKQLLDMHYRKAPIYSAEKVFVAKIRNYYNDVNDLYYNAHFIGKVKELVPIKEIQKKALDLVTFCQTSKQDDAEHNSSNCQVPLDARDFFVIELMDWFHNCFFKWFDEPKCATDNCALKGFKLDAMGSAHPTIEDLAWGASRVELFSCSVCRREHRFPRYNNPIKLLDTRTGRCGEWGNCFTGILTALGYDARLVIDWTDHVWSEYFSKSQNRWIHLDSCEKAFDSPLTYEVGWQKKLTYCIAISRYDVQDVTWRYVSDPAPVLARRNQANETWLITFILLLNRKIRSVLPAPKQQQLVKRTIRELAEMIVMPGCKKTVSPNELCGRKSGSLDWRAARSELGASTSVEHGYVFNVHKIMQDETNCNFCEIRYNSVTDEYSIGRKTKVKAWNEATFSHRNIFKKTEYDWKMVYLARKEGSSSENAGEVTWKIDLTDVTWRSIDIDLRAALYQSGIVDLTIRPSNSSDTIIHLPVNTLNSINRSELPSDTTSILITATLSNGAGQLAWQHAQLFRQSIDRDAKNHSFLVRIIT